MHDASCPDSPKRPTSDLRLAEGMSAQGWRLGSLEARPYLARS